jgi:hypothetical protein
MGLSKHFIYYNLHKHLFSCKNKKTGLVEHRANTVILENCNFKVSKSGRMRVLKEQRKNVHAGVVGTILGLTDDTDIMDVYKSSYFKLREITYNPYKYDSFVYKDSLKPIFEADKVILSGKKVYQVITKKEVKNV